MYFMPLYSFEGRAELQDAMIADATDAAITHNPSTYTNPGASPAVRRHVVAGVSYYSVTPIGASDRATSAVLLSVAQALRLISDNAPEAPVIKDYMDDSVKALHNMAIEQATVYDPDWLDQGGFEISNLNLGPGISSASNNDSSETFVAAIFYIQIVYTYMLYPTPYFKEFLMQACKFYYTLYTITPSSWSNNQYDTRTMNGAGTGVPNAGKHRPFQLWLSEPLFVDVNVGATLCLTDGRLVSDVNATYGPAHYPAAPAVHTVCRTMNNGNINIYGPLPPELTLYRNYYVRQGTGSYQGNGWKYSG
jgi:hypothetical protein